MCANSGHSPDGRVSFSCRIAASLRKLPQDERPNLQEVLREYAAKACEINPQWLEQVGGDFAAGACATGERKELTFRRPSRSERRYRRA